MFAVHEQFAMSLHLLCPIIYIYIYIYNIYIYTIYIYCIYILYIYIYISMEIYQEMIFAENQTRIYDTEWRPRLEALKCNKVK